jgi:hypothetical protein
MSDEEAWRWEAESKSWVSGSCQSYTDEERRWFSAELGREVAGDLDFVADAVGIGLALVALEISSGPSGITRLSF